MRTFLGTVRGLGVGAFILVAFLLVNGGYVYRTTCPLPGGSEETSWTYGIDDLIPYVRSTSPPCQSQTATRIALDGIGVWKIKEASEISTTASDETTATALAAATTAVAQNWKQQVRDSAALRDRAKTEDVGEDARQLAREVAVSLRTLRRQVDRIANTDDPLLDESRVLLSRWLGYQAAGAELVLVATSEDDLNRRGESLGKELSATIDALSTNAATLEVKYDREWGWEVFLPHEQR